LRSENATHRMSLTYRLLNDIPRE